MVHRLSAIAFLWFAALAGAQQAQPELPELLRTVLQNSRDLRLLDPSVDLPGGYTVDEIKSFGYWPPWVQADLDDDTRPDVVATVVQVTPRGKRYGVVAVHDQARTTLHWIAPLGTQPLNGVAVNRQQVGVPIVTPLHCIECDSNDWYRWNGQSYEASLFAVGEMVSVATYEKEVTPGVFARPTRDSKLIARIRECTQAKVLRTRGVSYETRWYFVEVALSKPLRGWIPAAFASESECIG